MDNACGYQNLYCIGTCIVYCDYSTDDIVAANCPYASYGSYSVIDPDDTTDSGSGSSGGGSNDSSGVLSVPIFLIILLCMCACVGGFCYVILWQCCNCCKKCKKKRQERYENNNDNNEIAQPNRQLSRQSTLDPQIAIDNYNDGILRLPVNGVNIGDGKGNTVTGAAAGGNVNPNIEMQIDNRNNKNEQKDLEDSIEIDGENDSDSEDLSISDLFDEMEGLYNNDDDNDDQGSCTGTGVQTGLGIVVTPTLGAVSKKPAHVFSFQMPPLQPIPSHSGSQLQSDDRDSANFQLTDVKLTQLSSAFSFSNVSNASNGSNDYLGDIVIVEGEMSGPSENIVYDHIQEPEGSPRLKGQNQRHKSTLRSTSTSRTKRKLSTISGFRHSGSVNSFSCKQNSNTVDHVSSRSPRSPKSPRSRDAVHAKTKKIRKNTATGKKRSSGKTNTNTMDINDKNYELWSVKQVLIWIKMILLKNGFEKENVKLFLKMFVTLKMNGQRLKQIENEPLLWQHVQVQATQNANMKGLASVDIPYVNQMWIVVGQAVRILASDD